MSKLFKQILNQTNIHKMPKSFKASDFGFLHKSPSFLSKHSIGNPGEYTPYFKKSSRGCYSVNPIYLPLIDSSLSK